MIDVSADHDDDHERPNPPAALAGGRLVRRRAQVVRAIPRLVGRRSRLVRGRTRVVLRAFWVGQIFRQSQSSFVRFRPRSSYCLEAQGRRKGEPPLALRSVFLELHIIGCARQGWKAYPPKNLSLETITVGIPVSPEIPALRQTGNSAPVNATVCSRFWFPSVTASISPRVPRRKCRVALVAPACSASPEFSKGASKGRRFSSASAQETRAKQRPRHPIAS